MASKKEERCFSARKPRWLCSLNPEQRMQPNGSMGCAERVGWMLAVTFSGAQFLPPTCQLQGCSKEQSHFILYDCLAGAQPSHHGTGSSVDGASGSHQGQQFSHGRSRPTVSTRDGGVTLSCHKAGELAGDPLPFPPLLAAKKTSG